MQGMVQRASMPFSPMGLLSNLFFQIIDFLLQVQELLGHVDQGESGVFILLALNALPGGREYLLGPLLSHEGDVGDILRSGLGQLPGGRMPGH
jgi:hypothetical protein